MSRFFVKCGLKDHLQQIVDGKVRFSPAEKYIKEEQELHNKGQGDLLEGKLKIKVENGVLCDPDTNEAIYHIPPNRTIVMTLQDVSEMPILCLSSYSDSCIVAQIKHQLIKMSEQHISSIKHDLKDATHALIILEPDKFISSIHSIANHSIVSGDINYFQYDINPIEMYMFLATGNTSIRTNEKLSVTYDNRFRHLLCKDISFSNQNEYRFIILDQLIYQPIFHDIDFNTSYKIVEINELINGIQI